MKGIAVCLVGLSLVLTADVPAQGQTPQRNLLVIIDDLHLEFRETARVRDLLRRTLERLTEHGDLVAMVSTGPSRISVAATGDQKLLEEAVKRLSGNGLSPTILVEAQERGLDWSAELRHRANRTFSVATAAVRALKETGEIRVIVLYFSNGYLSELVREPTDLIEAALPASAVIYAIDPRFVVSVPSSPGMTHAEWDAYVSATQESLRVLARRTGGRAVFTVNEWAEALAFLTKVRTW